MGMKTLLLLGVLFLTGCTGASFQGAPDGAGDPEAGAGGEHGGAGGEGLTETGGTPSQGGTAGSEAGSGGVETGGAPETGGSGTGGEDPIGGAGSSGSAGASMGGTAGAGGQPEPSCAPEDVVIFPESFTWSGFESRFEDVSGSYCASSTGGHCTFRNVTLSVNTERKTLTFMAYPDCDASFSSGECGKEMLCETTSIEPQSFLTMDFIYTPSGDGYVLSGAHGVPPRLHNGQACWSALPSGSYAAPVDDAETDLHAELMAALRSQPFACP